MEQLLETVESAEANASTIGQRSNEVDMSQPPGEYAGAVQQTHVEGDAMENIYCNDEQSQPNPWHRDYTAKLCGLRTASVRDRVYIFLLGSSLNELRAIGRETRTKHSRVKNTVICQLMLKAQEVVASGQMDWDGFFGGRFRFFWTNPSKISTPIRSALYSEDIIPFGSENTERSRRTAAITTHEFARLVGIIVENEEARLALIRSGINLTRVEQRRRMDRDEFWENIVARLHNDATNVVEMSLLGRVDADEHQKVLNPNQPVPQRRSGAWLKDKFFSVRACFTRAFHKWSRSGRNNPEGNDFANFVPRAPSSTAISTIGRHCLILFYAMKCGTENEDVEILNIASKIMPFGAGHDDGENEISGATSDGVSRKRKQVLHDILRENKVHNKNVSELVQTVKTFICSASSSANLEQNDNAQRIQQVVTLTKQLNELRQLDDGSALTRQSITITEATLRKAQVKCTELLQ